MEMQLGDHFVMFPQRTDRLVALTCTVRAHTHNITIPRMICTWPEDGSGVKQTLVCEISRVSAPCGQKGKDALIGGVTMTATEAVPVRSSGPAWVWIPNHFQNSVVLAPKGLDGPGQGMQICRTAALPMVMTPVAYILLMGEFTNSQP